MAAAELVLPSLSEDSSPAVRLQAVIFIARLSQNTASYVSYDEGLTKTLDDFGYDPLIPNAIWNAVRPYLTKLPQQVAIEKFASDDGVLEKSGGQEVIRRLLYWTADERKFQHTSRLLAALIAKKGAGQDIAAQALNSLAANVQTGSIKDQEREALRKELAPVLADIRKAGQSHPDYLAAIQLEASWKDPEAVALVKKLLEEKPNDGLALDCLRALVASGDASANDWSVRLLDHPSPEFQGQVLFYMSRLNGDLIGEAVLKRFDKFAPDLRPKAIELLTQRPNWSKLLLEAVAGKVIDKDLLNLNQLRRVASFKDDDLRSQFKTIYGVIREGRNPDREQIINSQRDFLHGTPGDPKNGHVVFKRVCAQCHKIYGEGAEVGPDITSNGRNNWDQLVTNVLDPSLVIGGAYQARILATTDGRVLTGIPVEETDQKVILKVQGGKLETIPRDEIEQYKVSDLSMMPEQLEKQVTSQELADLFAFLALDKPPGDASGKILPGAPRQRSRD
jgi:putative heme-binding domain-containing protein